MRSLSGSRATCFNRPRNSLVTLATARGTNPYTHLKTDLVNSQAF
ncbi:MAG TPA: hypothetical protein VKE91_00570 [Blastocatellia bacterium]|nr:hypothetical protein [Blastocatellia bacterium]